MARDQKTVRNEAGIDRRESGYYSTPIEVATYLSDRLLSLKPEARTLLDPCIGAEELTLPFSLRGVNVVGHDIIRHKENYVADFSEGDFIEYYRDLFGSSLFAKTPPHFDLYVLNPPYNCHEVEYIQKNKSALRELFPETGAYNMYTMFLDSVMNMATQGDLIGVVTSDSFLTAKYHANLRRKIFSECIVHDLLLCPTDLFLDQRADVRTCILVLEKGQPAQGHMVRTLQRPESKAEFFKILHKGDFGRVSMDELVLRDTADSYEVMVGVPAEVRSLFKGQRLGDTFPCITGISTGNDEKFLRAEREDGFSVPFFKNPGSKKFHCQAQGFIIDDYVNEPKRTKNFMVRNKDYLGQEGICCSSMGVKFSACYLPKGSAFGVNPNVFPGKDIWWVLAYLNSTLTLYLLRGVLIRGNMVNAGYVAKLPLVNFSDDEKVALSDIAIKSFECMGLNASEAVEEIDEIVFSAAQLSGATIEEIKKFSSNVVKNS